jgi:predicted small metal-binding protein
MKFLSCHEIGNFNCEFVATGSTDLEIINKMFAHTEKMHPEFIQRLSNSQIIGLTAMMDSMLSDQELAPDSNLASGC